MPNIAYMTAEIFFDLKGTFIFEWWYTTPWDGTESKIYKSIDVFQRKQIVSC